MLGRAPERREISLLSRPRVEMITLAVLPLITQALKLVNLLIEGTPIEQRQAQARVWFAVWYPLTKGILKLNGVSDEELKQIEELAKGKP